MGLFSNDGLLHFSSCLKYPLQEDMENITFSVRSFNIIRHFINAPLLLFIGACWHRQYHIHWPYDALQYC